MKLLQKNDIKLLLVFCLVSIGIVLKSYFQKDGYLSQDSTNYLRLSQNLLDGNGFYVTDFFSNNGRKLFAVWPIGYPLLISIIAKLFNIGVFWASKILNIIFVGISLVFFKKLFKKNAYVYAMIFFTASYLKIYSHTFSEVPFVFGFLWLSISIFYFMKNDKNNLWLINLLFASLFLFLSRYAGAFSIGVIGLLLFFYLIRKEYKTSFKLLGVSIIVLMFITIYLYNNYLESGYLTGVLRAPAPETNFEFIKMLIKSQIDELNLLWRYTGNKLLFLTLLFFQFFIAIYFLFIPNIKKQLKLSTSNNNEGNINKNIWRIFLFVGIIYWFSIVFLRWSNFFTFNFRILSPATFLFLLSLITYIESHYKKIFFNKFKLVFIIIAILSFILNVPLKILKDMNEPNYYENLKSIENKYDFVKKNSIVVFGNRHLNYLRMDIQFTKPLHKPIFRKVETMNDFIKRVKNSRAQNIYIEITEGLDSERYDKSVIDFMRLNRDKKFLQIK